MDNITLIHIALHSPDEEKADIFFRDILGLTVSKERLMFADRGEEIFGIKQDIKIKCYSNEKIVFEIFITNIIPNIHYEHVCVFVENKDELINKCKKYGIKIIRASSNEKDYLFIRDFSGYLYEIK